MDSGRFKRMLHLFANAEEGRMLTETKIAIKTMYYLDS